MPEPRRIVSQKRTSQKKHKAEVSESEDDIDDYEEPGKKHKKKDSDTKHSKHRKHGKETSKKSAKHDSNGSKKSSKSKKKMPSPPPVSSSSSSSSNESDDERPTTKKSSASTAVESFRARCERLTNELQTSLSRDRPNIPRAIDVLQQVERMELKSPISLRDVQPLVAALKKVRKYRQDRKVMVKAADVYTKLKVKLANKK